MAIAKEIALTAEQIDQIMTSEWNMRIATVGPGRRINVTPMWFGWAGGKVYTYGRGQKVINLRKNPNCTVLIDRWLVLMSVHLGFPCHPSVHIAV